MEIKGMKVVLTGASGGIGKAIARCLAEKGADLILLGGTNADKLKNFAEELRKDFTESNVTFFPCDLTDDTALNNAFTSALSDKTVNGSVDVLINNAGIAYGAPFEETDLSVFDKIMALNFRSAVAVTKLALPYIKRSDRGTIINIASVVAHNGYPEQSAYTASKHALLGFTKALAAELYKTGVRVHAVSPGGVYTDMIKITRPDLTGEDMIMPEDVARIVLFLIENRTNAVIDEISVHRANKQPFLG